MRPFEEVVEEHGAVVLRVCRALLGATSVRDAAHDAWSETFLAALRAYPDLRPDSDVRAWLVTIAHNKAIDQLRSAGRAPLPTEHLPERPTHDQAATPDEALLSALAALPPKQRGAVAARYLADCSYAQVAALLECSEAAARRSASDGIAALRRTYDGGTRR